MVGNQLTVLKREVVIAIHFNQSVFLTSSAIDIVVEAVIQFHNAVDSLTVLAEGVGILGQIAVGFVGIVGLAANCFAGSQEEVVVTFHQSQAGHASAFHDIAQVTVAVNAQTIGNTLQDTVLCEVMPLPVLDIALNLYSVIAGQAIAILKIVPVAVDQLPLLLVVAGTVVVADTVEGLGPDTGDQLAVLLKVEVDTANLDMTVGSCHGGCREVIPFIVNHLPAAGQDT